MTKNLLYQDDIIEKYWSVFVTNTDVFIEYGEVNKTGWIEKKTFDSNALALEFATHRMNQKIEKGYQLIDN